MLINALQLLAVERLTPEEAAERLGISTEAFFALIGPFIESVTVTTAVSEDQSYSMNVEGHGHAIAQGQTVHQTNITVVTPGGLTVTSPEKTREAAAKLDRVAEAFAAQVKSIGTYAFEQAHPYANDRQAAVEAMAKAALPAFLEAIELKVDHADLRVALRNAAKPALVTEPYGGDFSSSDALTSYAVYLVVMGVNAYAVKHKRFEVIAEVMNISASSRDGTRIPVPLLRYDASRPLVERNSVNWSWMMQILRPVTGVSEDHYAFADLLAEAAFIQEARKYKKSTIVADIGGIHYEKRRGPALKDFYEDEKSRLQSTLASYLKIALKLRYSDMLSIMGNALILG